MTPTHLIELLASFRTRLRRLTALYGLGVLLCVAGASFAVFALFDWIVHLSKMWRTLFAAAAVAGTVYVILHNLLRPLASRMPVTDIAGRLERLFPQFQDRLRSAVGFIQRPGEAHESAGMRQATIEQAINLASALPLRQVIDPRPAMRSFGLGLALMLVIATTLFLLPTASRTILLTRLFNPVSNVQWPKRVSIELLGEVAQRVPFGGQIDVQMKLARGDSAKVRPILFYETEGGVVRQEFMTRGEDGRYATRIDARAEALAQGGAMKVWIVAGDDRTDPQRILVVPRLAVASLQAKVTPPPYVRDPQPTTWNLTNPQAAALVGSTVEYTLAFNKPLASVESIRLTAQGENAVAPQLDWVLIDERTARAVARIDRSLHFRVNAQDRDGFDAAASRDFDLMATPDLPPTVTIEAPKSDERRTPDAVLPVAAQAADDSSIRDLTLLARRLGQSADQTTWSVPFVVDGQLMPGPGAGTIGWQPLADSAAGERHRLTYAWSLAAIQLGEKLKPGDVAEFWLRVQDDFELDGKRHDPVDSEKLKITFISQEALVAEVTDVLRQVRAQIEQVKRTQDSTAAETENFQTDTKAKETLDAPDASVIGRIQQQQGSTASAARALAERLGDVRNTLEENRSPSTELAQMSKAVAEQMERTSEGSMTESMRNLTEAARSGQASPGRNGSLDKARQSQEQSSNELADALRKLEDIGSLNATIDQLEKSLVEQREVTQQTREVAARTVGKSAQQMSAADRKKLEELANRQQALGDQSKSMTERLGKTADQLNKTDPKSAEAMRAAQKQAQSQRVSPSQQQAAQQMRQNKQGDTRQSQQQAEIGLQMMLNELKQAQKQKLAELQRKLAELQQQIEILIRRQSGHNLDNLTLQGNAKLQEQAKLIEELKAAAARKPDDKTKPEVGRLLAGQGQTERNARDIAKKAADVEDGAEPAARVTRAATLMERAAVNLRDRKLVEAYEPPQLDALNALSEAKRLIDQKKQEADDAADQETREAIRAVYERVKGDQILLKQKTVAIESRRGANGQLNRADAGQLANLVTDEQKLADQMKEVAERLSALDSVVYVWANQQVVDAMGEVKSELGQGRTAAAVQRREQQIIDELTAMIDNLKVSPRSQRFEQQQNGGNGGQPGQGGPKLPSEAELRLMKQLQETVNANTRDLAQEKVAPQDEKAAADRDDTIIALGRRQGAIRKLLGELIGKASRGQQQIGPEPKDPRPLPEEADLGKIEDQELEQELLTGAAGAKEKEANVQRVADRMARSRQRLETDRDTGKVTQIIQQRIQQDFDLLIEAARQQQQQSGGSNSSQGRQEAQPEPQPNDAQAQNSGQQQQPQPGAREAARQSNAGRVTGQQQASGRDIRQTAEEWGRISPRLRGPVLESREETVIERYRRLVEDYTQAVSTEASGGNARSGTNGGEP